MKREIICGACKGWVECSYKLTTQKYPEEHYKIVSGKAKGACYCDSCGKLIWPDDLCDAFSVWSDYGGIPYYEWEEEFIVPSNASLASG